VTTISTEQGLSSHAILSVVASKDGNIWIGTDNGLNKWRNGEVTVYRRRSRPSGPGSSPAALMSAGAANTPVVRTIIDSGLPADSVNFVFEDGRGQIWVTTNDGVAILTAGRFVPVGSVPAGIVFSITEDRNGTVWLSHQEGLFRLRDARVVERIPWATLRGGEPATVLLRDEVQDGVWLGFRDGHVAYFKQGQVTATYATREGLGSLHIDPKGTLWATTRQGLSRVKNGRVLTLSSENGLPCNTVHWMMEDDTDSVWLYTACGVVRIAQSELDAWASPSKSRIHATVFDGIDGVRIRQFHVGYSALVAKAVDGNLWFVPVGGLSIIDPHHLAANSLPPPVQIEQGTADGQTYAASNGLQLPAGVRDLSFEFTALSLVVAEKVRFRVKLEGQDDRWRDLVNQRHVQYTNLPPRTYRLRVLAANNSGVWNAEGASLEFVIPPMWYQTKWLRALAMATFLALLWAAYLFRMRQLQHAFDMTLDTRVAERTRIARELHDTLLQSLHGLLLRFQTASYLLPERPAEAKDKLDRAIEQAAKAITEGRDAVQGLRASTVDRNDLAAAIRTLGDELAAEASAAAPPALSVAVEGQTRDLRPIIRDEIYRIAAEALRNAFRHAQATCVEVEIQYDKHAFRLRVRDDGRGIDSTVLASHGVEGHFGLRGMPERAALIGGKLAVWSEVGGGTELELRVPASAVYLTAWRRSWWSRLLPSSRSHSAGENAS
jgi:signal transduction histidine kinase